MQMLCLRIDIVIIQMIGGNNPGNYIGGIEIRPDSGGSIINFPEQHIKLGIAKNKNTKYNYKKCVRIAKNMREEIGETWIHTF